MLNNVEFVLFYLGFSLLGRSLFLVVPHNKKFNNTEVFGTKLYIFYPVFGVFFTSALIFISNFLTPLKSFKPFLTGLLFVLIFINFKNLNFQRNFKFLIINYIVMPFILAFSSYGLKFHYDSEAYHLATQSWIFNSKIVFGLSKFYIWLGHSSLYEYLQAYLNIGGNFIYQHYLTLLFVTFFVNFLYFHLQKGTDSPFFYASLLITIFGILDNFGIGGGSNGFIQVQMVGKPDVSVGILFALISIFSIYGIYIKKLTRFEFQILFLLFTFSVQIRILSAALIVLLIPLIYFNWGNFKNFITSKFSLFLIFYNLIWLVKNLIISSCLFFPLKFTCFNNLSWNINQEIYNVSNLYDSWVYAYQFNQPLSVFLKNWFNSGHNATSVTNFLLSLIVLFVLKKSFFKSNKRFYRIAYISLPIFLIIAFYYTAVLRYWYGLIIFIVAVMSFNIEIKEKYKIFINRNLLVLALITLSVGYPRGYSYKYFFENQNYFELNISYEDYETKKNPFGYGVIAQKNKCFDIYYCTTFQHSDNKSISLNKFYLNYQIFEEKTKTDNP